MYGWSPGSPGSPGLLEALRGSPKTLLDPMDNQFSNCRGLFFLSVVGVMKMSTTALHFLSHRSRTPSYSF